ncbi:phosphoribosylformylglycinamidine synthase subunit PurQ [Candidatus Desantisbacteria bacterium]|nr:phosphoribosylformylglycinamidine synthase subunit PurQ [Candidatus Desantisbacteria bacterium]
MKHKPKVAILVTDGTNCDMETFFAFSEAGGKPQYVHINQLFSKEIKLEDFQILALPGGFSYGDDIISGKILANQLIYRLKESLERFIQKDTLILGICNGFQVLVRTGILPFGKHPAGETTLVYNDSNHFQCEWVDLKATPSVCVFTGGLEEVEISWPIAHAEGKFIVHNYDVYKKMLKAKQIVLKYKNKNPNGSFASIADILDKSNMNKKKLSVCIVTQQFGSQYNKSGLGSYTNMLVEYLINAGEDVTVCTPDVPDILEHKKTGIRFYKIPVLKYDISHGKWISFAYNFAKILKKISGENKFDVIHFTDAREALFCKKIGIPFVGTQNDYYFAEASSNPLKFRENYKDWIKRYFYYQLVKKIEPVSLKKMTHIITAVPLTKKILREIYHIPEEKMDVIYYGIKENINKKVKRNINDLMASPKLLFVGANYQRKGLPLLLKALALVIKKFPNTTLNVIGENSEKTGMIEMAKQLGVHSCVNFLGFVPNDKTLEYFSMSDIFIMPSLIEAFGIVFLEAMSSGVPVIGSNTGGISEVIKNGENGFLVDPADHEDLAEKIIQLITNPDLREKFIQGGYGCVKNFSIENMGIETEKIYHKVIHL